MSEKQWRCRDVNDDEDDEAAYRVISARNAEDAARRMAESGDMESDFCQGDNLITEIAVQMDLGDGEWDEPEVYGVYERVTVEIVVKLAKH